MNRHFNTTGPCFPDQHYMVDARARLPDADRYIEQGKYFVVHAPRQSGKTTTLLAVAEALTRTGKYAALYTSCQAASDVRDLESAIRVVIQRIDMDARVRLPPELRPPPAKDEIPAAVALLAYLEAWSLACPRPVVLLMDEVDSMEGLPLANLLHQLRDGYHRPRPSTFPWSIILCGMRDPAKLASPQWGVAPEARSPDYRLIPGPPGTEATRGGTGSPFNIAVASIRIGEFDEADVGELFDQYTGETGQAVTPEARARVFRYTQGQPWLTNALARELTEEMRLPLDLPITAEHVDLAKERLIQARAMHLDSLIRRLMEPRVRRVIEPIVTGAPPDFDPVFEDDIAYAIDLGLIARDRTLRIANPIYQEVIVRVLTTGIERRVMAEPRRFVRQDGRLDWRLLLDEFVDFWKENGEILTEGQAYHEAAPHLVLMAFLQRVVNGGGQIVREAAAGKRALDLLVTWPCAARVPPVEGHAEGVKLKGQAPQREAIEIKVRTDRSGDVLQKGLAQLDGYLERLGLNEGTLVIFDRRADAGAIHERTRVEAATSPGGRSITVLLA